MGGQLRRFVLCIYACMVFHGQASGISVNRLSQTFDQLMNNVLGVPTIQKQVSSFEFDVSSTNGSKLLRETSSKISDSFRQRFDLVRGLAMSTYKGLKKGPERAWTACCTYDQTSLSHDNKFRQAVDEKNFCEIIAPTAPPELSFPPLTLLDQMMDNKRNNPSLKWQYVANYHGVMTNYPAFKLPGCSIIDPRFRPWYVNTARRQSKIVLILLDVSRSMEEKFQSIPVIDVARQLIGVIFKTLTPTDRVGVVAFNNKVRRPDGCFGQEMALATYSNLEYLKENFLRSLIPSGESMYSVGFKEAFSVLLDTASPSHSGDYNIVFISDGQPKEVHHRIEDVYETINAGNEKLDNRAIIYPYGIGGSVNMTILEAIAAQQPLAGGKAVLVDDVEMLENVISSIPMSTGSRPDEVMISAPYIDVGGLGLIVTVSQPIFHPNNSLYGVVGVDITLSDLIRDDILLKNNQHAYFFIVDHSGRVTFHPLLRYPVQLNQALEYVTIDQLERDEGFNDIMTSLLNQESGSKTIRKRNIFPLQDRVKTVWTEATYLWEPIKNTTFSLCLVLFENSIASSLRPKSVSPLLQSLPSNFRYHRFDLEPEREDLCRHFYHKSTLSESVLIFAPRSFANSFLFPEHETRAMVDEYKQFFNRMLSGSDLNSSSAVSGYFVDDVTSDVMWTSLVDRLWVGKSTVSDDDIIDKHVAQRYVGTRSGVSRVYPGTMIRGGYDPTTRIWYQLAVANPNLNVMTPPYQDAGGAGTVVTISRTISTPTVWGLSGSIMGVMGVDVSLDYLYSILINLDEYRNCSDRPLSAADSVYQWQCFLMDSNGNFILHPDYRNGGRNQIKIRHIAEDRFLLNRLLKLNFARKKGCLETQRKLQRTWYELDNETFLNDMDISAPDVCTDYFMRKVPGTNVFFLARYNRRWCYTPECPELKNVCRRSASNESSHWMMNCPCSEEVDFNPCENKLNVVNDVVPCSRSYPFQPTNDDCIPTYLSWCIPLNCQNMDQLNCSTLVGCNWCFQTNSGAALQQPYCSISEECYNGLKNNPFGGFDSSNDCPARSHSSSLIQAILGAVSGGIVLFTIVLVMYCFLKRKLSKNTFSAETESCSSRNSVASVSCSTNSSISNPTRKRNENPAKKSDKAPRVIITVVDSKGSEMFRKPVQLIHGDKTFGAPPHHKKDHVRRTRSISLPSVLQPEIPPDDAHTTETLSDNEDKLVDGDETSKLPKERIVAG